METIVAWVHEHAGPIAVVLAFLTVLASAVEAYALWKKCKNGR